MAAAVLEKGEHPGDQGWTSLHSWLTTYGRASKRGLVRQPCHSWAQRLSYSWLALIPAFAKFAHERAYDRDFEGDISKPVTSSSKIPRILDYQQFLYSQPTQIQRSRFSETIREILSPEV